MATALLFFDGLRLIDLNQLGLSNDTKDWIERILQGHEILSYLGEFGRNTVTIEATIAATGPLYLAINGGFYALRYLLNVALTIGVASILFLFISQNPGIVGVIMARLHTAPKSWCMGVIQQVEFRQRNFPGDLSSVPVLEEEFHESNCDSYGLVVP